MEHPPWRVKPNTKSALTKMRARLVAEGAITRSERAVTNKMTGSVESDSTADMVAPARETGRDGNMKHFPSQQRTPDRSARPQASPQLQHSDRKSKIHFGCLEGGVSNSRVVGSASYSLTKSIFSNRITSRIRCAGKFYNGRALSKYHFCLELEICAQEKNYRAPLDGGRSMLDARCRCHHQSGPPFRSLLGAPTP